MVKKQNKSWAEAIPEIAHWFDDQEVFSVTEETTRKLLSSLDEREKKILKLYYGVGCPRKTFRSIGVNMGISANRACQIRNKARRTIYWRLRDSKRIVNTKLLMAAMKRIVVKLSQCSSDLFEQVIVELLTEQEFTPLEAAEFRKLFN
jgi:hypothetical protein